MWKGELGEREHEKNRKKTIDVPCGLSQLEDFGKLFQKSPYVNFSETTRKSRLPCSPQVVRIIIKVAVEA